MAVFANHAHLFPTDIWPEGDIDHLLRLMDECGFERAVVFAPFAGQWKDREGTPTDWIASVVGSNADRIVGYAALNPERPDAIPMLHHARELGLRGVKMHPAFERWSVGSPKAYEFFAAAQEVGMPLDFHTGVHGHQLSAYHPLAFDDVACRFPALKLVFEHVGGFHFFKDMLGVMANHAHGEPRLFAGIASVLSREVQSYWYLGPEGVETILWQLGDRVAIYGLDFPYNKADDVKRDLGIIRSLNIPDESKERILGGNLHWLIG